MILNDTVAHVEKLDGESLQVNMFLGETVEFTAGLTPHPTFSEVNCPVLVITIPLDEGTVRHAYTLGSPGAMFKLYEALGHMLANGVYGPVVLKHAGVTADGRDYTYNNDSFDLN